LTTLYPLEMLVETEHCAHEPVHPVGECAAGPIELSGCRPGLRRLAHQHPRQNSGGNSIGQSLTEKPSMAHAWNRWTPSTAPQAWRRPPAKLTAKPGKAISRGGDLKFFYLARLALGRREEFGRA